MSAKTITAPALAALLEKLDSGDLTISELRLARPVIREAVARLRDADVRIAAAKTSLRDQFAVAAMASGNYAPHEVYMRADAAMAAREKGATS